MQFDCLTIHCRSETIEFFLLEAEQWRIWMAQSQIIYWVRDSEKRCITVALIRQAFQHWKISGKIHWKDCLQVNWVDHVTEISNTKSEIRAPSELNRELDGFTGRVVVQVGGLLESLDFVDGRLVHTEKR